MVYRNGIDRIIHASILPPAVKEIALRRGFSLPLAALLLVPPPLGPECRLARSRSLLPPIIRKCASNRALSHSRKTAKSFSNRTRGRRWQSLAPKSHTRASRQNRRCSRRWLCLLCWRPTHRGPFLFLLAIRGHGYFLAVDYGNGQQVMFSMGKNVRARHQRYLSLHGQTHRDVEVGAYIPHEPGHRTISLVSSASFQKFFKLATFHRELAHQGISLFSNFDPGSAPTTT